MGRQPPNAAIRAVGDVEQFEWFLAGLVVASGAPEPRKRLTENFVDWNNGREAL